VLAPECAIGSKHFDGVTLTTESVSLDGIMYAGHLISPKTVRSAQLSNSMHGSCHTCLQGRDKVFEDWVAILLNDIS